MLLIIGLGNPGFRYRKTRHNAGFLAVDYIQKNIGGFSKWKLNKKLQTEISEGLAPSLQGVPLKWAAKQSRCDTTGSFGLCPQNDNNIIILAKPQTYMNKSGGAVKLLVAHYLFPERAKRVEGSRTDGRPSTGSGDNFKSFAVIHDDFDLPISEFKIEKDRGTAGHKGVQSIIDALGTNEFSRLRIGIRPSFAEATEGKPVSATKNIKAENFVLKKFAREERKILEKIIPIATAELLDKTNN